MESNSVALNITTEPPPYDYQTLCLINPCNPRVLFPKYKDIKEVADVIKAVYAYQQAAYPVQILYCSTHQVLLSDRSPLSTTTFSYIVGSSSIEDAIVWMNSTFCK